MVNELAKKVIDAVRRAGERRKSVSDLRVDFSYPEIPKNYVESVCDFYASMKIGGL